MKSKYAKKIIVIVVLGAVVGFNFSNAQTNATGILGKDDWLFYRFDFPTTADKPQLDRNLDTIKRFNKILLANGTSSAMLVFPFKSRIYAEFLPPAVEANPFLIGGYDYILKSLSAGQINSIDLNTPLMNSANRNGPYPLFLKLDRHLSPSGGLVVADAIKVGIDANPILKKSYDAIPVTNFQMNISKQKKRKNSQDLVPLLPANEQTTNRFTAESTLLFNAVRSGANAASPATSVALTGSSNSQEWNGFPDALRTSLQRDVSISTANGIIGPWFGMLTYLRGDAFQKNRPKLLLWEIPERDVLSNPDASDRDTQFKITNTEWLLHASALVQVNCKISSVKGSIASTGLAAKASNLKSDEINVGPTTDTDFIQINFNAPIGNLDYLSAQIISNGSMLLGLEASGAGVSPRRFTYKISGDSTPQIFKYPLPSNGKGFTQVRLIPGRSNGFSMQGIQVCRQPEDLLN